MGDWYVNTAGEAMNLDAFARLFVHEIAGDLWVISGERLSGRSLCDSTVDGPFDTEGEAVEVLRVMVTPGHEIRYDPVMSALLAGRAFHDRTGR